MIKNDIYKIVYFKIIEWLKTYNNIIIIKIKYIK